MQLKEVRKICCREMARFYVAAQSAFTAEGRSNLKHETGQVRIPPQQGLGVLGRQTSYSINGRKLCIGSAVTRLRFYPG